MNKQKKKKTVRVTRARSGFLLWRAGFMSSWPKFKVLRESMSCTLCVCLVLLSLSHCGRVKLEAPKQSCFGTQF